MKKATIALIIAFLLNSGCTYAQTSSTKTPKEFVDNYDAYIRKVMEPSKDIPGMAVVVIKDDKPIFLKAYGMSDREHSVKADTDTLFYIASSTKSFTALVAALLDREGKIKLSDPITKYAAGLDLKGSIPEKVTVRDLLTHTSGLSNDALTFRMAYSGESDKSELARVFAGATKYDDTAYGKYKYDNLGYNIYAVLLQNHLKLAWQDVLRDWIFKPLGMKHTTAYVSEITAKKWTHADGYVLDAATSTIVPAPLKKVDNNLQSAGGIFASISDIGRWLEMNINDGRLDGKQVIPADVVRTVHTGYTQTTRDTPPFAGNGEYGLGWQIGKYKNDKVIYHNGGFTGYRSHISFMPEKKIGVAVLVNNDLIGSMAADVIATYAYDALNGTADLDAVYTKRLNDMLESYGKLKDRFKSAFVQRAARTSQLTMPFTAYTGQYTSDYFGTIEITQKGAGLFIKMGNIEVIPTAFTQKETIRVELIPGSGEVIKFNVQDGKVVSLTYSGADFKRQ